LSCNDAYQRKELFAEDQRSRWRLKEYVADPERVNRYEQLRLFLIEHQYEYPQIHDLERIAPLPPAALPPWDSIFEWTKHGQHTPPPPQPSKQMLAAMARARQLDPASGRPLP